MVNEQLLKKQKPDASLLISMMGWLVKLIISFNLIASIENRTCSG